MIPPHKASPFSFQNITKMTVGIFFGNCFSKFSIPAYKKHHMLKITSRNKHTCNVSGCCIHLLAVSICHQSTTFLKTRSSSTSSVTLTTRGRCEEPALPSVSEIHQSKTRRASRRTTCWLSRHRYRNHITELKSWILDVVQTNGWKWPQINITKQLEGFLCFSSYS